MFPNTSKESFHGTAVNFYCNLKIKGKQLISANILHMVIREWIFDIVPRIELVLSDDGILTEVFPLQDGDIISVELRKNDGDTEPYKMDFYLLAYTAGAMHGSRFMQIMLSGVMKVENFYAPIRNRSFTMQNSADVFNQILRVDGKCRLNSTTRTTDLMSWLQIYASNLEMCRHVIKRSYKPNDIMFLYADGSGVDIGNSTAQFNYTSFQTEVFKKAEQTAFFDLQKFSMESFTDNADYNVLWYNTYNIYDFSSYANKIRNYGVNYNYFSTSEMNMTQTIFNGSHPLSDLSAKDKSFAYKMSHNYDFGYLPGNVYDKYYDAIAQNDYLRYNFFGSFVLELNINPLSKPRLFGKVNVSLPSVVAAGNNEPMSGEYIVAGMIHEISKDDTYRKRIMLCRNGYNISTTMPISNMAL